jgi:CopG family nickel-responsive transcriptional regulator
MAAVVLVYRHGSRDLDARLARIQHGHPDVVVSALHVHVDRRRCMEVIVLRGERALLSELGYRLIGTRGVLHGRLVPSTTGEELP